jgi:hypothetical protein
MEIKFRQNLKIQNIEKKVFVDLKTLQDCTPHLGDDILEQYINLKDMNGDEIYENDMLIDRKNGNCFNVFRVDGGFGINAHKSDFNFEKRPSVFYESVAEPRISKYISGNCEIIK